LELALGHVKKFEICLTICADVHNWLHNTILTSMHLSKDRIEHARTRTHAHLIKQLLLQLWTNFMHLRCKTAAKINS